MAEELDMFPRSARDRRPCGPPMHIESSGDFTSGDSGGCELSHLADIGFGQLCRGPAFAFALAVTSYLVVAVFGGCAEDEMLDPNARPVVAPMIDLKAGQDASMDKLPHEPVREHATSLHADAAISAYGIVPELDAFAVFDSPWIEVGWMLEVRRLLPWTDERTSGSVESHVVHSAEAESRRSPIAFRVRAHSFGHRVHPPLQDVLVGAASPTKAGALRTLETSLA